MAAVVLPVLYVASFGPACWISSRAQPSGEIASIIYRPLIEAMTDDSVNITNSAIVPGLVRWCRFPVPSADAYALLR